MAIIIRDSIKLGSILLNIILTGVVVLLVWLLLHRQCPPCDTGEIITTHTDTIPVKDTAPKPIIVKVPEAYKTVARKKVIAPASSSIGNQEGKGKTTSAITLDNLIERDSFPSQAVNECDSIRYYCEDTIIENSAHIIIEDTVIGKITGRSVWFVNLKPEYHTTTTKVRAERVKLYGGAMATINSTHMERWGIGPSALLTIPQGYGFDYYYDAKNNAHTAGFYVLIKLRK